MSYPVPDKLYPDDETHNKNIWPMHTRFGLQAWEQLNHTGSRLKVYIFSGSFGSLGSAVDEITRSNPHMR